MKGVEGERGNTGEMGAGLPRRLGFVSTGNMGHSTKKSCHKGKTTCASWACLLVCFVLIYAWGF